jgi:hypothetical protein
MIKNFKNFVKESYENRGKGPGNQDLIPEAPKKQTINRAIPTMDFLRIGKHIQTKKIDGFVDSIQNENIFIADRITGEIKKYTFKEVLKELAGKKEEKNPTTIQGFEGTPAWAKNQKIYEKENIEPIESSNPNSFESIDFEVDQELVGETYNPGIENDEEKNIDIKDQESDKDPEIELSDDEEDDEEDDDDTEIDTKTGTTERNKALYGTEDNPEGINKGTKREMPNESWIKYWESFNNKQHELIEEDMDEEDEKEEEVPVIRGTEDNPLPDKRKPKIENYE